MRHSCAVCGRERDEATMTCFVPTDKEKAALKDMGEEAPLDAYHYCRACVRILSNPNTAIPLMKGVIQFKARSVGVDLNNAEAIAERFGKKILAMAPKPRS